ncbi:MAG: hypothetical protein ACOC3T_03765, partial [Bacteroidota bacterium]
MKNIYLFLRLFISTIALLLGFTPIGAQMTESFESATAPPTGWSIVYQDPTPTTTSAFAPYLLHNKMMHISPQDPYQPPFTHYAHDTAAVGSKVFRFSSYASDTSNLYQQYLISPP